MQYDQSMSCGIEWDAMRHESCEVSTDIRTSFLRHIPVVTIVKLHKPNEALYKEKSLICK